MDKKQIQMMQSNVIIMFIFTKLKDQINNHYHNMDLIFNTCIDLSNFMGTGKINDERA